MTIAVLATIFWICITLALFMWCSGWSCIVRWSRTANIEFTLSLWLISSCRLCLDLGRLLDGDASDRESLAHKYVLTIRVQVVQCFTVDPQFIQLQTSVKLYFVVPAFVRLGELVVCRWSRGGLFVFATPTSASFQVLVLLHEQVGPIIVNALLHYLGCRRIVCLLLLHRRFGRDLNHRLS